MSSVILIGAGQLGGRHLQGLLKYSTAKINIFVLDPSSESLILAKKREEEIPHKHTVHYIQHFNQLCKFADFAIVATNADVRELVIQKLLAHTYVPLLVLEKVLFQDLDAYDRVYEFLTSRKVKTFVNHPRRLNNRYKLIKEQIERIKGRTFFSAVGESWDMGCNGLHMLDLFTFLSHSYIREVNADGIDTQLLDSKRAGFVEFSGTLTGIFANNDTFSIASFPGKRGVLTISISTNGERWLVQEGGAKSVYTLSEKNNFEIEKIPFSTDLQSSLTTELAENLFMNGTCNLPEYEISSHTHKLFINALLRRYNLSRNTNSRICPIT